MAFFFNGKGSTATLNYKNPKEICFFREGDFATIQAESKRKERNIVKIIEQYAKFIHDLQYGLLPEETRDMAKRCLLDGLANLWYGTKTPMGKKALEDGASLYGKLTGKKYSLPGGERGTLEQGLFTSAILARCADLDDGHRQAMGHPGSLLIPLLLMEGQALDADGKTLLTALIGAYEIYIRLGNSINPSSYRERGFDSTGVTGAVACTAFLGKVLALSPDVLANALGIAASFSSGLIEYQNDGSMGKILCGVWAISTARRAIALAQAGYTGPAEAIEGKKGFCQAFSNDPKPELALERLGKEWKIREIYFKQHACMRGLHAGVDAMLFLRESHHLDLGNVQRITVYTTPFVGRLSKPCPKTEIGAQCSIKFALATALWKGNIASTHVLDEALENPQVRCMASSVRLVMDPELEQYVEQHPSHWGTVRLEIELTDGRKVERTAHLPKGEAEDPLTWEELADKFRNLTKGILQEKQQEEMLKKVQHFEQQKGTQGLVEL